MPTGAFEKLLPWLGIADRRPWRSIGYDSDSGSPSRGWWTRPIKLATRKHSSMRRVFTRAPLFMTRLPACESFCSASTKGFKDSSICRVAAR
eukprot:scaffold330_cov246-Pinguiococcus_pyrenoidosus.AAC.6